MGVEVLKTDGSMKSLTDILAQMGPALQKLPKAKQLAVLNEVFGKRAIAGAGELVTQAMKLGADGKNAITRFTDSLKKSDTTAKSMAKTLNKGAPGAVKSMASAFEGLQIAIAESGVLDMFTSIVKSITGFIRELSKTNPTFLKFAAIAAVVVAAIGPLLVVLGGIIAMIPSMMTGFALLKTGIAALGSVTWVAMLPFIKFIAIAGLFAAAAFMIIKNWKPIKQFFVDLFNEPLQQMKDMLGFAGSLAKKAGAFFGFGDGKDETDRDLEKQGFKISGGAQGAPLGADKTTKKNNDFEAKKLKAAINVDFSNMPKGTNVVAEDKSNMLTIGTGAMGAL